MWKWREEYKKLCLLADYVEDEWWRGNSRERFRSSVFAIEDKGGRRELIAHLAKLPKLTLQEAYLDVERAQYRLEAARCSADGWWLLPSASVVFWCVAALALEKVKVSPVVGAIAAAAYGILFGFSYRDARIRAMRDAVRAARIELKDAKEGLQACQAEKETFSAREVETGDADKS